MLYEVGTKYKSKNGLVGTIERVNGIRRLLVRNNLGIITQTINLTKIDLHKFEEIEDKKST